MHTTGVVMQGMFAGVFMSLLGVLCFVFNRRIGGWLGRFPLVAFGVKPKAEVDEIIWRGLACLAGLFCAGLGLAMLASSFV